jgi:hypothetical protein
VAVSRVGPPTRLPPTGADTNNNTSTTTGTENGANSVSITVVIALAVSALICLCMFILIVRNNREAVTAGRYVSPHIVLPVGTNHQARKKADDNDASETGTRSCQQTEQLVVMAGEHMPTFLAHPIPAPSTPASSTSLHIQCPPLHTAPTIIPYSLP